MSPGQADAFCLQCAKGWIWVNKRVFELIQLILRGSNHSFRSNEKWRLGVGSGRQDLVKSGQRSGLAVCFPGCFEAQDGR